jgi:hypothetical protein
MKEVFPIAAVPATLGNWLIIALLVSVPLVLIAYFQMAPRLVRFEVSPEGLRIRGDLFYSRMIPARDLDVAGARVVNLESDREHQLSWRRNGTALPNYKGGWFNLKNGEKALVFVGDRARVAYIPVRSGYTVLLSVADPERLIQALPR